MEYKKCEHCGEKIHIRSQKCPFCNQTVSEVPIEEVKEDNVEVENKEVQVNENDNKFDAEIKNGTIEEEQPKSEIEENKEGVDASIPTMKFEVGADGKPKDYVYKAEVRHSLEYTNTLSNMAKVFISALCTVPIIGQLVGVFLGVFFSTYDDSDRRSFGRALLFLSIFMFVLYLAYTKYVMTLIGNLNIDSLLNK